MNSLEQMLGALGDPAVRQWGHRVIDAARVAGHELSVDEGRLRSAIDEPLEFHGDGGEVLWWEFWQAYGAAVARSKDLIAESQPFASRFRIFRQDPKEILSEDLHQNIDTVIAPIPSEFELVRKFRDIAAASDGLKKEIVQLGEVLRSSYFDERQGRLIEELDDLADASWSGISSERERLFEIQSAVRGAGAIAAISKGEFAKALPRVFRGMMSAIDFASKGMKQRLGELRVSIMREFSIAPEGDDLSPHFCSARLMAAEAYVHVSEILRIALNAGMMRRVERPSPARAGAESLDELSEVAFRIMSGAVPEDSLRRIAELTDSEALADAATIDAALRRRFGEESIAYAEVLRPFLERGLASSGGAPVSAEGRDEIRGGIFSSFLRRSLGKVPVHVEFGGGRAPAGLDLATKFPDSMVFSVDPAGVEMREEQLSRIGFVPVNFTAITGRGEGVVPFAFEASFAESALMVMPPDDSFYSLLLSAILVVKPGGVVRIWRNLHEGEGLDFLKDAGFEVARRVLDGGGADLPPGDFFDARRQVEHARITLPGDGDELLAQRDGPFIRVIAGGLGAERSVTRKRPIRVPRGPASVSDISAGVFAAPLNASVAAPCAAQSLSLFTGFLVRAI